VTDWAGWAAGPSRCGVAAGLRADDQVALERPATRVRWRLIEPHVARVVISNPVKTRAIAEAKVKTDKVDADPRAAAGRDFLPGTWLRTSAPGCCGA